MGKMKFKFFSDCMTGEHTIQSIYIQGSSYSVRRNEKSCDLDALFKRFFGSSFIDSRFVYY